MPYNPTYWRDKQSPFLDAQNLNKIEKGITDNNRGIDNHYVVINNNRDLILKNVTDINSNNDLLHNHHTIINNNRDLILKNVTDIGANTNAIKGLTTGETPQGTWTPASAAEYPPAPQKGFSWYVDGLTAPYLYTGGDLSGDTANNGDKLLYNGTSWSLITAPAMPTDIVFRVATVGDLTNVDHSLYSSVIVEEKGRGGTFVYNASAGADDDGTVFSKWERQINTSEWSVAWFGAKPEVGFDNHSIMQDMFDKLALPQNKGISVYIPAGVYEVGNTLKFQTIRWDDGGGLRGESAYSTILKFTMTNADTGLIVATETAPTVGAYTKGVRDLSIIVHPNCMKGLDLSSATNALFQDLQVYVDIFNNPTVPIAAKSVGVHFGNWYVTLSRVQSKSFDIGYRVEGGYFGGGYNHGVQGTHMRDCGAIGNDIGIMLPLYTGATNGITDITSFSITDCIVESQASCGIYIEGTVVDLNITNNYFEAIGKAGATGVDILNKDKTGDIKVIGNIVSRGHIVQAVDSQKVNIHGNKFGNSSRDDVYCVIANPIDYLNVKENTYQTKKNNGILHLIGIFNIGEVSVDSFDKSDTGIFPDRPLKIDGHAPNLVYTDRYHQVDTGQGLIVNELRPAENTFLEVVGMAWTDAVPKQGGINFRYTLSATPASDGLYIELPTELRGHFRVGLKIHGADSKVVIVKDSVEGEEIDVYYSQRGTIYFDGLATTSLKLKIGTNYTGTLLQVWNFYLINAGMPVNYSPVIMK